jgi:hypothetical protein
MATPEVIVLDDADTDIEEYEYVEKEKISQHLMCPIWYYTISFSNSQINITCFLYHLINFMHLVMLFQVYCND